MFFCWQLRVGGREEEISFSWRVTTAHSNLHQQPHKEHPHPCASYFTLSEFSQNNSEQGETAEQQLIHLATF